MCVIAVGLAGSLAYGGTPRLVVEADCVTYRPGQTVQFTLRLANPDGSPLSGTIRLEVVGELDATASVHSESVELQAGENTVRKMQWQVPAEALWGYMAQAFWEDGDGQELVSGQVFFAVGEPWKVGHWSSFSSMGTLSPREIKRQVMGIAHRWHIGAFDYFSWQPSGWETMAPELSHWNTGQNVSPEDKSTLQEMIRQAHVNGMQVYSYLQGSSWGLPGLEWIRAHPELWNLDEQGRIFPSRLIFNGYTLDQLRGGVRGGKYARAVWAGSGIIWGPPVREYLYDQLRQSVEMFDWDGFRSDGLPYPGNAHDVEGHFHQALDGDLIASQVEFIADLRRELKSIDPDCTLHFNAGAIAYHAGRQSASLFKAKAADSMALWESGGLVERGSFDLADFDTYIDYLHQEVGPAREVGGYRQVGYSSIGGKLIEAATTACGAKWALTRTRGAKHFNEGPDPWRTFTFRYSRFFWDPAIRHVADADDRLSVEAPDHVRWRDFVHRRREADGREFLMVHLVNFAVPYKPGQLDPDPPIERDLRIALRGDEASRVKRVVALTCDGGTADMAQVLTVRRDDGVAVAELDALDTWSVVVFELSASE